jgi:hypothetical protein
MVTSEDKTRLEKEIEQLRNKIKNMISKEQLKESQSLMLKQMDLEF